MALVPNSSGAISPLAPQSVAGNDRSAFLPSLCWRLAIGCAPLARSSGLRHLSVRRADPPMGRTSCRRRRSRVKPRRDL
eukprot:15485597-Alexandrium_andersonii.AAC.1